jgi:hypothetical protein
MPAMLEIYPTLSQESHPQEAFNALMPLLLEADAVFATKQRSPANMIGDWQSIETVYAVVDEVKFYAWQNQCFTYLRTYFEDAEALVYGFRELCHFPSFFEFLEGHKFLKSLELAPCFEGVSPTTHQPLAH